MLSVFLLARLQFDFKTLHSFLFIEWNSYWCIVKVFLMIILSMPILYNAVQIVNFPQAALSTQQRCARFGPSKAKTALITLVAQAANSLLPCQFQFIIPYACRSPLFSIGAPSKHFVGASILKICLLVPKTLVIFFQLLHFFPHFSQLGLSPDHLHNGTVLLFLQAVPYL